MGRGGRRVALGALAVSAALALSGCGYDPGTAGDQAELGDKAPNVSDVDVAEQRAAHLLADASELLPAVTHVQSSADASPEAKEIAGQLRGILEQQTDRLGTGRDGASMVSAEEVDAVTGADGPAVTAAFGSLLHTHVPRLAETWSGLSDAGDPDIADVARDTSARLKALVPVVEALPRG